MRKSMPGTKRHKVNERLRRKQCQNINKNLARSGKRIKCLKKKKCRAVRTHFPFFLLVFYPFNTEETTAENSDLR